MLYKLVTKMGLIAKSLKEFHSRRISIITFKLPDFHILVINQLANIATTVEWYSLHRMNNSKEKAYTMRDKLTGNLDMQTTAIF